MTRTMDTPTAGVLDKLQRRTLMKTLGQAAELLEDLEITITRTDSMAPMRLGSTGHKVRVVPFNQSASDARIALEKALRVYALRVQIVTSQPAPHTPQGRITYLQKHLPGIPDDAPSIEGIYTAIVHASDKARRTIDSPRERIYTGACDHCGTSLYAVKDATSDTVTCRTCGVKHAVAERRDALLESARNHVATAAELARFLPWFAGKPIKANTIVKWAERGKLTPVIMDGHTMYRIGDVIALHTAANTVDADMAAA